MEPIRISHDLLNLAPLLYFAAMTLAVFYWIKKGRGLYLAIPIIAGLALACHTTALGLRWVQAGFYRPPWTNLYESLVYFSWGLALLTWGAELRFKVRSLGLFGYALVFAGLGLAYLTPGKAINPLVPALQSWWILAHSFLAAFAYSGLIIASLFSFLFLLKKGVSVRRLLITGGGIGLAVLVLAGGKSVFLQGNYTLNEMVFMAGQWVKNPIPGTKPPEFYQVTIPVVANLFWVAVLFYGANIVASLAGKNHSRVLEWGRNLFAGGVVVQVAAVVWTYWQIGSKTAVTLGSAPYHLGFVTLFAAVQIFLLILAYRSQSVAARLPEAAKLDSIAYQFTMFGFPFMTLILITGAIWAHEAWGRYWGWDPKETTALMTWLIYAAYLHLRRLPGWAGQKAAIVSIVGFFSVIFTYLGANLVLSGLHSYGAQ